MAGLLDVLDGESAHIVGHDWGAAVACARPVPTGRANRLAELVPGEPGARDAGASARPSVGAGSHARCLVDQRSLPALISCSSIRSGIEKRPDVTGS
jgi:pimeloyl-ACP methyl ester carboxylesterase